MSDARRRKPTSLAHLLLGLAFLALVPLLLPAPVAWAEG